MSEIYAPVAGEVVAVNAALADAPETLNADPYGEGGSARSSPRIRRRCDALLDASGYRQLIDG